MDTAERIGTQTAANLSKEFDRMIDACTENIAPQAVLEIVIGKLAASQPWITRLLMEDAELRERYWEALAALPATARRP